MKKLFLSLSLVISMTLMACGQKDQMVNVVSREEGSGTRSAFVELTGVLEESDGKKQDKTSQEAIIQMQTEGVIQAISNDPNAIGYISTGSLSNRVKALTIEEASPSKENIKSGDYKISRPFILVHKNENKLAQDFLSFINSKQGAALVAQDYIALDAPADYRPGGLEGKLSIAGSTSVASLIEKLGEEYKSLNPQVTIEIQQTGSSAGISSALDGTVNLGMSSRDLSQEEEAQLSTSVIALDGIAVIVNLENPIDNLSMDQVREVFNGNIIDWSSITNEEK